MAEIRKIVPRSAMSNFQQVAPEAGGGFRALALAAQTAYDMLKPAAMEKMTQMGAEAGREMARRQVGDPMSATFGANGDTLSLIRGFEGFRETPYWDVNALRTGYGSDTITLADGTVRKVTAGDKVTQADADRDLQRRVTSEFEPAVSKAIGADVFAGLSAGQKASLTSIAYNYGELPDRVASYVRAGDMAGAAAAIKGLGTDNGGINAGRRTKEADLFSSSTGQGPTVIRTAEGGLEPRLFSPASGEILAAHDAAAQVAYNSEVMLKGQMEMMGLSERFLLDPEGFRSAAAGYVEGVVEGAPDRFRTDIRSSLEKEMQRRYLGVMEEKQRDIRQRADNSSAALVDRWSANLSEAMAAGNKDEIDSATAELDSLLQAREALPGVAWTPEQSDEVFRKAAGRADQIRSTAVAKVDKETEAALKTIADAAKSGMRGVNEAILEDPNIQAKFPDLWRKAVGAVTLRDWLPSFKTATPAEMAATVAELKGAAVGDEFQVTVAEAAEKAQSEAIEAWRDDPIAHADEVLPNKPPPLPDMATATPETITSSLAARKAYGLKLVEDGYIKTPAFLTDEEATMLGSLMGKDIEPEVRSMLASTIVQGFGEQAGSVFREIKSDDPVTRYGGMLMAGGGSPVTSATAMRGQQMLDEGLVQAPSKAVSVAAISPEIAEAMSQLPNGAMKEADVLNFATAIYAAGARGVDPASLKAKELMAAAVQQALGQETKRGRVTGGVQEVGGFQTLLPLGISGEDISAGVSVALGREGKISMLDPYGSIFQTPAIEAKPDIWGGKVPMLGGEPIKAEWWDRGLLRMVPVRGKTYRMEVVIDGSVKGDVRDADGNVFTFDAEAVAKAGYAP